MHFSRAVTITNLDALTIVLTAPMGKAPTAMNLETLKESRSSPRPFGNTV
jgi:hypothetical protein